MTEKLDDTIVNYRNNPNLQNIIDYSQKTVSQWNGKIY